MGFRYGGIDRQVNTYFEDISGQFIMYQGALNYGKMALLSAKNVEMNACTFSSMIFRHVIRYNVPSIERCQTYTFTCLYILVPLLLKKTQHVSPTTQFIQKKERDETRQHSSTDTISRTDTRVPVQDVFGDRT